MDAAPILGSAASLLLVPVVVAWGQVTLSWWRRLALIWRWCDDHGCAYYF
jgi:hypothetical protein